ncbi:MAG: aldehyde ferredoxin oxidoreductase C-terminal domain-containing protein, partial [Anaerolineales bacterium]
ILPERFFEEGLTCQGRLKGIKLNKAQFSQMVQLYYQMMGWDKRGCPSEATLLDHHLDWVLIH